jgi:site-specific DNA-methyltransferase (adenine-specific)
MGWLCYEESNMNMKVHYSSKTEEWETPQEMFDKLNKEYNFTLDPCATNANAKCECYFDKYTNGLLHSWKNQTVFMNPPYGRSIVKWMAKAYEESLQKGTVVVCLVPSRTDTIWWHQYAMRGKITFIKGRLKFGGHANNAPFPSVIVVFGEE